MGLKREGEDLSSDVSGDVDTAIRSKTGSVSDTSPSAGSFQTDLSIDGNDYLGWVLVWDDDAKLSGEGSVIVSVTPSSDTVDVTPNFSAAPDDGDGFKLYPMGPGPLIQARLDKAISALNDIAQSDILSDGTPFAGANIDDKISNAGMSPTTNDFLATPKSSNVKSSGTADSFGSWVQLTSGFSNKINICAVSIVVIDDPGANLLYEVEIGLGASGSESAIISAPGGTGQISQQGMVPGIVIPIVPPREVAASTRIAARVEDNISAQKRYDISVIAEENP